MARKTTFVMLALTAILLLQFADCMSAMAQDQQSMQCCGSMPCNPSNQSHDCCKGTVSPQTPTALPAAQVTLNPPLMIITGALLLPRTEHRFGSSCTDFALPQYSPPELYTLHSSFLL